ncbi:MAG: lipid biosynthesis B12-binding/radical SAM protein [Desulfobacterales bacterium]|nr:lipid biosynthesis B12-binding/radical SAM protein [Desulfobacterales bacterium]
MSKIFLLSSNVTVVPYPVYPLGISTITKALNYFGHEALQFDLLSQNKSEDNLIKAIIDFHPDFIGISIRNIDDVDSFSQMEGFYLDYIKCIIETIREVITVPIILGGPAFSIIPSEILDYLKGDYGVVGEGEISLCDLINDLSFGKIIPRIIKGISTNEIFSPVFEKDLIEFYIDQSGILNLQTKRGCPYSCSYCTYPTLEGNRFRLKDPKYVVDNLKYLIKGSYWVSGSYLTISSIKE